MNVNLIVTNKKNAVGALKARRFGKPVFHFTQQHSYSQLTEILKKNRINGIMLAGYMKLLPPDFIEEWKSQILNIHPSLLPLYPGLGSAEKSWLDNSTMGVTIHKVIAEMDAGGNGAEQDVLRLREKLD